MTRPVAAPRRARVSCRSGLPDAHRAAGRSAVTSRGQDLVTLTMNSERWSLRSTLSRLRAGQPRVHPRVSEEGGTIITFGDGIHGKALPHGGTLSLTIAPETPLPVSLERTQPEPTPDQGLWTVIRQRGDGTELEIYAPCEEADGGDSREDTSRAAARWRLLALILGVLLLALALWR